MLNIIPSPAEVEMLPGAFRLTTASTIQTDEANRSNAGFLRNLLAGASGFPLKVHAPGLLGISNSLRLRLDPALAHLGKEGYRLEVHPEGADLAASTTAGVFYAIQTLRQMMPVDVESRTPLPNVEWSLPCTIIQDRPCFGWRGFMLDEGRHFHGVETIRLTLDLMAMQKLNVFHWHLTEDQGWRIEIKKYPRLTEVGAWRRGTSQSFGGKDTNGVPHGGFYTQGEIREIVAYATERQIRVVPEIEMPGHSLAALAAHPELSCTGGPFEVAGHFGIFPDILCAGKEATFQFIFDVLDEVLGLFPSPFIHIGGDEAPKVRWKNCPDCQRRLHEEALPDEHALQSYLTNRVAEYLDSRGRRLVGWNQILHPSLNPAAVAQYWLGSRRHLMEALRSGRQVVMSTYLESYLDHGYSLMPLSRAYRYEPIPPALEADSASNVLGLEFPLWTEWVPNRPRLDYQAYPRLTAMAETAWTPKEKKDFQAFRSRLVPFLERLHRLGVQYAPLAEVEPPFYKRLFGLFTIARAQKRVTGGSKK